MTQVDAEKMEAACDGDMAAGGMLKVTSVQAEQAEGMMTPEAQTACDAGDRRWQEHTEMSDAPVPARRGWRLPGTAPAACGLRSERWELVGASGALPLLCLM